MIERDQKMLDFIKVNGVVTTDDILDCLEMEHKRTNYVIVSRRMRALAKKGLVKVKPRPVGTTEQNKYWIED